MSATEDFLNPRAASDPERFPESAEKPTTEPLRVVFGGRLVPCKDADMLPEACLPLIKDGRPTPDMLGDGLLLDDFSNAASPPGCANDSSVCADKNRGTGILAMSEKQ